MIPVKVVGSGLPIQFFYFNMRRLGNGLMSDPDKGIPGILLNSLVEKVRSGMQALLDRVGQFFSWSRVEKV